ncbi:MAG: carboxymuconolactone decarboxylase family protein [Polyangiaceae bacterium]
MTQRINYASVAREPVQALYGIERYLRESELERSLIELVKLRASYMNGCAYCVDMHTKDARAAGETEQRLYAVPVWRETPFFTARERVALGYTEALTHLDPHGISDAEFAALRAEFSERQIVDLTFTIVAINAWNRLTASLGSDVGSYVVGQHKK